MCHTEIPQAVQSVVHPNVEVMRDDKPGVIVHAADRENTPELGPAETPAAVPSLVQSGAEVMRDDEPGVILHVANTKFTLGLKDNEPSVVAHATDRKDMRKIFLSIPKDILDKINQYLPYRTQIDFNRSPINLLSKLHNGWKKFTVVQKIVTLSPNLVELNLRAHLKLQPHLWEYLDIRALIEVKATLQDLNLSGCRKLFPLFGRVDSPEYPAVETLIHLTALRKLDLSEQPNMGSCLPKLTILPQLSQLKVSSDFLYFGPKGLNFPSLSCLELDYRGRDHYVEVELITSIFSSCKNLEEIRVQGDNIKVERMLRESESKFLASFTTLKILDLTKVEQLDPKFASIAETCFRRTVDKEISKYPDLKILVPPVPLPKSEVPDT